MPKRLSQEEFIDKANQKHSNFYTYNNLVYTNSSTKAVITCPIHGDFEQRPYDHVAGRGCPKCNVGEVNSLDSFVKKANLVHNNKYDYSKATYSNNKTKVIITCPVHGDFKQAPANHIHSKQGCKLCGYERTTAGQTFSTAIFIEKATAIHGNKYDYSKVHYVKHDVPVNIICSKHGVFSQKPIYHLSGSNCQQCSEEMSKLQFDPNKETTLYYVYFPKYDVYKIGITSRTIKQRFYGDNIEYAVLASKVYKTGYAAWKQEQRILSKYLKDKYDGPPILYAGNSELFITNIFPKGFK